MNMQRKASVFRNGRNQAISIPREFELAVNEVLVTKDGDRLVIEPVERKASFAEWLQSRKPLAPKDRFPKIDRPPAETVDF